MVHRPAVHGGRRRAPHRGRAGHLRLPDPAGPGVAAARAAERGRDVYVVEGEATFHVDGAEHRATAGATVFVPRGTPHAFRIDSETARVLVINTPAGHEEFFRAMSEPAPRHELPPAPDGPPDMARMAAAAADAGFEILGPPPF